MHIALFLQYYHTPDCPTAARPYALVERLARDHEVTVITTRAWMEKRLTHQFPWVPNDVRLVAFDVPYDNSMSPLERLRSYIAFATRAIAHGMQMPAPDLIIGSSTPLSAAAAAGTVAHLRNCPWIFEVRDLWPDFPIQMGALPWPPVQQVLYSLERILYQSAAQVVTLSPDMETHVRTVAPTATAHTLKYGTDLSLLPSKSEQPPSALQQRFSLDRRFLILYAGTLGRANAIPTLLDTATRLSDRSDLLFAFAGRGYHESTVRHAARHHEHIRLLDPLPYPDALTLFSLADISLVSFIDHPVLTTNSPSKFYDSLSTGTPVVVTNPGWTKRFVERHECGWYVPPESPSLLASHLRSVLSTPNQIASAGENARQVAHRLFDRAEIMDQYSRLVSTIGRSSPSTI